MVCPSLGGGGAERATLLMAGGLQAAGVEVHLVIEKDAPALFDVPDVSSVHELHSTSTRRSIRPLARLIDRLDPAFVYAALPHLNVAAAIAVRWSRRHPALVLSVHNNVGAEVAEGLQDGRLLNVLEPMAARSAAGVVAVSEGVAASLRDRAGRRSAPVWHVPNPIQYAAYRATNAFDVAPDDEPFRVVSLGRLASQKNYRRLVEAAALLRDRGCAFRMDVFGDGPERGVLEQLVRDHQLEDSVRLVPPTRDVAEVLATSHAYVQTSDFEGFGLAILEAMASALPVVSTDCDYGPRELIDDRTGVLVEPTPSAVADALGSLASDRVGAAALGRAGRARAEAYDAERVASRLLDLLAEAGAVR